MPNKHELPLEISAATLRGSTKRFPLADKNPRVLRKLGRMGRSDGATVSSQSHPHGFNAAKWQRAGTRQSLSTQHDSVNEKYFDAKGEE